MALEAAELLAAAAYLRLRGVAGGAAPPPSPPRADAAALSPALSRLATLELAAELATLASMDVSVAGAASAAELAAALPAPGAAPREMNYVIAASFGIEALVVGTVLSTRPTWLSATHGHGLPAVGAALAAGEAAGTVALFAMAPAAAQARVRRLLPAPFGVLAALGALAACALLLPLARRRRRARRRRAPRQRRRRLAARGGAGRAHARRPLRARQRRRQHSAPRRQRGDRAPRALFGVAPGLPFCAAGALVLAWTAVLAAKLETRGRGGAARLTPARQKRALASGLRFCLEGRTFVTAEADAAEAEAADEDGAGGGGAHGLRRRTSARLVALG
jgi:hypothetical protein